MRLFAATAVVCVSLSIINTGSSLAGVVFDPSFGDAGATITVTDCFDAAALALYPDGRIVVAGGGPSAFALARYDSNGNPDTSFDGDGVVTTGFYLDAVAASVFVQPDGKVVAAGTTWGNWGKRYIALARYNDDGTLDPSFGAGGKVTYRSGYESASDGALQPDSKIITAGSYSTGSASVFYFARFYPDGSVDTRAAFDFEGSDYSMASALLVQADGKIVAVGDVRGVGLGMLRLNPDLSLDQSFGDGGQVTRSDVGPGVDVLIQSSGSGSRILVLDDSLRIAAFLDDGSLDSSFGAGGIVSVPGFGTGAGMVLEAGGGILATGRAFNGQDYDSVMVRYTPDGAVRWKGVLSVGAESNHMNAIEVQPDGRPVTTGSSAVNRVPAFATARFIITDAKATGVPRHYRP